MASECGCCGCHHKKAGEDAAIRKDDGAPKGDNNTSSPAPSAAAVDANASVHVECDGCERLRGELVNERMRTWIYVERVNYARAENERLRGELAECEEARAFADRLANEFARETVEVKAKLAETSAELAEAVGHIECLQHHLCANHPGEGGCTVCAQACAFAARHAEELK